MTGSLEWAVSAGSACAPVIRWSRLGAAQRDALLEQLIDEERRVLRAGAPSFYTVVVARHRPMV